MLRAAAASALVATALAAVALRSVSAAESDVRSPVPPAPDTTFLAATPAPPCLCVFDIDRTLTGKQGWAEKCPEDTECLGVDDQAYGGPNDGPLLLSDMADHVLKSTCGSCYKGIVTAGIASGDQSEERAMLLKLLGGVRWTRSDFWQDVQFNPEAKVTSSLVLQGVDGRKQDSVLSMVEWWKTEQEIEFQLEDVYFFDDIATNVSPFKGTGINAKQVSCGSRGPKENIPGSFDGKIGGCGGIPSELVLTKGVHTCDDASAHAE